MSVNETRELISDVQARISSPFIFTYMWVFVSYNINHILFLFLEPLKISTKLELLVGKWGIWEPFILSLLVITFIPSFNNLAELLKQFWDLKLKQLSIYFKLKQYYSAEEYLSLEDKFQSLENRYRVTRSDLEDAQNKLERYPKSYAETDNLNTNKSFNSDDNYNKPSNQDKPSYKNLLGSYILPDEERLIINTMANSKDAKLMYINTKSGIEYSVDGMNIFTGVNSTFGKVKAKNAFENLIAKGLIKAESESVYSLTTKGFEVVDSLKG